MKFYTIPKMDGLMKDDKMEMKTNNENSIYYGDETNLTAKEAWEQEKDSVIPLFKLGLSFFNEENKSNLTLEDAIKTIEEEYGEKGYDHLLTMINCFSAVNILAKNKLIDSEQQIYKLTGVSQFLYHTVRILMQKKRDKFTDEHYNHAHS